LPDYFTSCFDSPGFPLVTFLPLRVPAYGAAQEFGKDRPLLRYGRIFILQIAGLSTACGIVPPVRPAA